MSQIQPERKLQPMICLVIFHEENTEKYLDLLRTKVAKDIMVLLHSIRRYQDICALPRCQMYIMFTEFTER